MIYNKSRKKESKERSMVHLPADYYEYMELVRRLKLALNRNELGRRCN